MNKVLKTSLKVIGTLLIVAIVGTLGYAGYINHRANKALDSVNRQDLLPIETNNNSSSASPTETSPEPTGPKNYLLIGSDTRGKGDPGRSDSLMLTHIPSDKSSIYLISIPRDLYVEIPGKQYKNKINAAFSNGGPKTTVKTVENLFDIKVDHVAMINFKGFMRLIETLDGVTINNPWEACDNSQHMCWKKGKINLDRDSALKYVRWRHGLPNGDLDRAENQQRVLKAIAAKILSKGTLTDPVKTTNTMDEMVKHITIDNSFTTEEIKSSLLTLNINSAEDIKGVTVPIADFQNMGYNIGEVDIIDDNKFEELKTAIQNDTMNQYYDKHSKTNKIK